MKRKKKYKFPKESGEEAAWIALDICTLKNRNLGPEEMAKSVKCSLIY